MRKVILFNFVTLDGCIAGPNGEIDWHNFDAEFDALSTDQLKAADALLFGRVTYDLMASYWPSEAAAKDDPITAGFMNKIAKYVFSHTLEQTAWSNTTLIKEDAAEAVAKLKQQPGKDILLFGSADLAETLTKHRLIDEYRLVINPVVIGGGIPLFKANGETLKFKLINSRNFGNGNVMLTYTLDQASQ